MSRGPGKYQTKILDGINNHNQVYVQSLLADDASQAERCAITRAARQLIRANKIDYRLYLDGEADNNYTFAVTHPGHTFPDRSWISEVVKDEAATTRRINEREMREGFERAADEGGDALRDWMIQNESNRVQS